MTWNVYNGARRSKYGNTKVVYNGQKYDSKLEAKRAWELDMLEKGKVINGYERQVCLHVSINGIHVFDYFADFLVFYPDGTNIYEDVKSPATAKDKVFIIKKKCVEAYHGIRIINPYGEPKTKSNTKSKRRGLSRGLLRSAQEHEAAESDRPRRVRGAKNAAAKGL